MTDLSTLTDTELNERIHEQMGHEKCPCADDLCGHWVIYGNPQYGPNYTTSLDALKSGPEKMLREAGWVITVEEEADGDVRFAVTWYRKSKPWAIEASGPTEERARAEVVCLGLEAGK